MALKSHVWKKGICLASQLALSLQLATASLSLAAMAAQSSAGSQTQQLKAGTFFLHAMLNSYAPSSAQCLCARMCKRACTTRTCMIHLTDSCCHSHASKRMRTSANNAEQMHPCPHLFTLCTQVCRLTCWPPTWLSTWCARACPSGRHTISQVWPYALLFAFSSTL